MKSVWLVSFSHIRSWGPDYKTWAAFLLGLALCILNVSKYVAFSTAVGSPIQAAEAYIIVGSTVPYFTGVLLGALLLLSDAPFTSQRSQYEILRVGRTNWLCGQVCYIFFAVVIYSLAILLFSFAVCALSTEVTFADNWSAGMTMLAKSSPSFAVRQFRLSFPFPEFIDSTSPYTAMLLTLFFNGCYICVLCLCIFVININTSKNMGWIFAAAIHIAGYLAYANGSLGAVQKYSLLSCSIPAYQYIETYGIIPRNAAGVFLVLICLLIFGIYKSASRFEPLG